MGFRARWLTCRDPDAEELFRMVGEVFIFWSKSHVRDKCLFEWNKEKHTVSVVMINTFIEATAYDIWTQQHTILCTSLSLLILSVLSLCRISSERSKTLWWWMKSTICPSSLLTVRARWARWGPTVNKWEIDFHIWSFISYYLIITWSE